MNDNQERVLLVEDDLSLRRSLSATLGILGFATGEARSGEEALQRFRLEHFDAILLDINMPGIGGVEACRRIRQLATRVPIIMLTIRDREDDKVNALDAGADDYVTKPFQIRELAARLRSAIRRYRAPDRPSELPITIGGLTLHPERRCVERDGTEVHLTPLEFDALKLLMSHAGKSIPHARFHAALRLSGEHANRGHLRVLIRQLRKKLGDNSHTPQHIFTDGYIGYRFRRPDQVQ